MAPTRSLDRLRAERRADELTRTLSRVEAIRLNYHDPRCLKLIALRKHLTRHLVLIARRGFGGVSSAFRPWASQRLVRLDPQTGAWR